MFGDGVVFVGHHTYNEQKTEIDFRRPGKEIPPNGGMNELSAYPLAKMGVSGRLHDV